MGLFTGRIGSTVTILNRINTTQIFFPISVVYIAVFVRDTDTSVLGNIYLHNSLMLSQMGLRFSMCFRLQFVWYDRDI